MLLLSNVKEIKLRLDSQRAILQQLANKYICLTPTCHKNIDSSAGQGSQRAGSDTAVGSLHAQRGSSVPRGGLQEQRSVVQVLRVVPSLQRQRLTILKPRDIKRCLGGPEVAVQQEGPAGLQHYMAGSTPTAQLHRNNCFCAGGGEKNRSASL